MKIEEKPSMRLLLLQAHDNKDTAKIWREARNDGSLNLLTSLSEDAFHGLLGVSTPDGYRLGTVSQEALPAGMEEVSIPEFTWAVFPCEGAFPDAFDSLRQHILTEWLPTSAYIRTPDPCVDWYAGEGGKSHCEIWIPVAERH